MDGLQVLAGGVVLGLMAQDAGVHLHDVVQRVDEVDPFVQDHGWTLPKSKATPTCPALIIRMLEDRTMSVPRGLVHRDQSEPTKTQREPFLLIALGEEARQDGDPDQPATNRMLPKTSRIPVSPFGGSNS